MKKGEITRKKIFETAINLFKAKGYNNVLVDDIVANAGIAKGTFYIYFPSKAHVVAELFEEYDDRYDAISDKISSLKLYEDKVMAIVNEALRFTSDVIGCDLTKIAYQSQLGIRIKSTDINRPLYKILSQIIAGGQESGEFNHSASAEFYAIAIARSIRGTIYEWCITDKGFDIVEDGSLYMKHIVRILR